MTQEDQARLAAQRGQEQQSSRIFAVPAEETAFGHLARYGFAVLRVDGAPPVLLFNPERVLAQVLR